MIKNFAKVNALLDMLFKVLILINPPFKTWYSL